MVSSRILIRAIYALLVVVSIQVLIATPLLSWRLTVGGPVWKEWLAGGIFAALFLLLLYACRHLIDALLRHVDRLAVRPSKSTWLGITLLTGIVLRLLWVWWYPAVPASDAATYLQLGSRLSAGEPYQMAGTLAYWPPGYPFLLSPLISIFGAGREVIIGLNLALFAATLFVVYRLGQALGGESTGRIAAVILALWPAHITQTGIPTKEQPVILIVALAILILFAFKKQFAVRALLAGVLLGFGSLIQPGLLLLTLAALFTDALNRLPLRVMLARLSLIVIGMLLVISPWSIRNYQVFDQFVLISTKGGDVLYRANNPLATGGYMRTGEIDLDGYGELEANALGSKLAKRWIQENPLAFLNLIIKKQILFLGDDSTGVYETLRRGGLDVSEHDYALWKGAANLYWITIWILILRVAWEYSTRYSTSSHLLIPLILSFFYLYSVHSIAESGGKYHLPVMGLMGVIAAFALKVAASHSDRRTASAPNRSMLIASREFWFFVGVGGVATAAHYALLITLVQLFLVEPTLASTAGFILGATVNYILNYRITFRSTRAHRSAIPRFIATASSGMLLNAMLVALSVHILHWHYLLAQVVSTIIVLFWNYLTNKHWTFSSPLISLPIEK